LSALISLFKFDCSYTVENAPLSLYERNQLKDLDIDKIHFSGKYPTIFFKEVKQFNKETLTEIANIHHNLWNYKRVMFLYVTSLTEIRIYNCNSKPEKSDDIEKTLEKHEIAKSNFEDKKNLNQLLEIFSASAIDSGSIWTRDNEYLKQIKLDKRIDKFLVTSLVNLAEKLEEDNIDLDVIHSLIMRSLFVMYLEDKSATPEEFYKDINEEASSYFDLLEDKESTYTFFKRIQDNFNGNVFPITKNEENQIKVKHLKLLKQCFINGDLKAESLFSDWRIFKFDIINIELLSQIYENFLSEIDKESSGSYYTPPELVELILNEVLPIDSKNYNIKVLDPTCGSGIFLVEAYKRVVLRWQNAHPNEKVTFKILKELMQNSIYGIELNKNSMKVTTFSLYLSMLDFLYPTTLWYQGDEKFPYLINDKEDDNIKIQGNNLFRTDAIDDNKNIEKQYDIIVGNPPYGKKVPSNIKQYCNKENFVVEFVIPFIHKFSLLAPNGKVALLAPTKLLTNTLKPSQNFRKWLFNDNYVEKIYNLSILRKTPKTFGGQLFSSAVPPASIFFFQNKSPQNISKTVEYWAPKTYIKSHIAEGVLIDSSDIKYLPRNECQKSDTKIWKVAHWGTLTDYMILSKFNNFKTLEEFFNINNFKKGVGLELSNPCNKLDTEIKMIPHMGVKSVELYNTNIDNTITIENIKFRRKGTKEAYKAPHVLIKEGIKKVAINNRKEYRIVSSFLDYDCSYYKGIIGIYHENIDVLKALTSYINSIISKYFMFISSSSWGIERDIIKANELFLLPSFFDNESTVNQLSTLFDSIQSKIYENYPLQSIIIDIEKKIDNIIFNVLNLSLNEKIFIQDTINYSLDLFNKGDKSIAIEPINNDNPGTIEYSSKLCKELNDTLEDSDLKVVPTIYRSTFYSPLCLVVIQFIDKESKQIDKSNIIDADDEFNQILSKLNKYTLSEYSKGIYVQKNITYFDDDKIYIVKSNQKRFWNLSSAIEDSQNITLEIMSMD